MISKFNTLLLNDLKRRLEASNPPPKFYDQFSLENFVNELSLADREKVFTISSQAIIQDIHESLTQVLSMTRKSKMEKSRFHYFALPKEKKALSESSSDEVQAISVCELTELTLFYEEPFFQQFINSIALLNQRNYQQVLVDADPITAEDLSKFILENDSLLKKKPIVKVVTHKLDEIIYILQQIIPDFGQGYKAVLSKENEEKFYFSVSNSLMYQFNSTGKFVRRSIGAYVNKLYSNFVAVAAVFENKLLRKFNKQQKLPFETQDAFKKIHLGALSFTMDDCDKEEQEYAETPSEIQAKNKWFKATLTLSEKDQQITDSSQVNSEIKESKKFESLKNKDNFFEAEMSNAFYQPQQQYAGRGYKRRNQPYMPPPMRDMNQVPSFYPSNMPDGFYYPMNAGPYYPNNNITNTNYNYYNYNSNYISCGFGDEFKRIKKQNGKYNDHHHYRYVKMQ